MVFYAYVTESCCDPAENPHRVLLTFTDPGTADEWWCAISEIPKLAEAIRRINSTLYTNDTTKFNITTFFNSFDATVRALSQRFRRKLIITLVNDDDEHDDPQPCKPAFETTIRKVENPPQAPLAGRRVNGKANANANANDN